MLDNTAALLHVLRFLMYPEVAVQSEPYYWLLTWGEREVYRHQDLTLRRIAEDKENNDKARHVCAAGLEECATSSESEAYWISSSPEKWTDLEGYVELRCYAYIYRTLRYLLHTLQYVVKNWSKTIMNRAPGASNATWYSQYPTLAELCPGFTTSSNCSKVLQLPLGTATGRTLPGTPPSDPELNVALSRK